MTEILLNPFGWDVNELCRSPPVPMHLTLEFSEFSQGPPRSWMLIAHGPNSAQDVERRGDWFEWLSNLEYPREDQMKFDDDDECRIHFQQFGTACALVYRRGRGKRVEKNRPREPIGAA